MLPVAQRVEKQVLRFRTACQAAGITVTNQRLAIYKTLAGSTEHPAAEVVWDNVRKQLPAVSLDTVYRAFRLFEQLGLLTRVETGQNHARFDGNLEPHHHFVCTRCGTVFDFESASADAVALPASVREMGIAESIRLEVRGVCSKCREEE